MEEDSEDMQINKEIYASILDKMTDTIYEINHLQEFKTIVKEDENALGKRGEFDKPHDLGDVQDLGVIKGKRKATDSAPTANGHVDNTSPQQPFKKQKLDE